MREKAKKENIQRWIEGMAKYNSTPDYGTTRILFTKPEIANRNYVKDEMRSLGLQVEEDSIGNIFAKLEGTEPELAPVWTGSHIDTVPNAGNFDGMSGVVCGMEALRMIREGGEKHIRSIMVNVYTSEEPTRYGLGCLGSRAMSGELTLDGTKKIFDQSGRSLYEKLTELKYDLTKFEAIKKKPGDVYANVELHVEQNSRLEKLGKPIGIVTAICAPSNYEVEVTGIQSHAGGTSMEDRRDSYMAAAEMALYLEQLAKDCPSEYNTATIGIVKLIPGGTNVIPGKTKFSVDIRDCRSDTKQELIAKMKQGFDRIAEKRGVTYTMVEENNDVPLTCNEKIIDIISQKAEEAGYPSQKLISGPFHDTLFIGKFAPAAMIFVPSKNGISHSPDEWTEYEDLVKGTNVLAETLMALSNSTVDLEK